MFAESSTRPGTGLVGYVDASSQHCSLISVNKKTTYKPTYVQKNVPEATRKKIYMASNGQ